MGDIFNLHDAIPFVDRAYIYDVSSNKLRTILWQWNILKHEEDLPIYKAVYFFIHYAVSAFKKILI